MGRRGRRVEGAARALPEAIAALSRSLPAGPSPEIFRRAKFDRPEAAPALWQLLFRVLSPLAANNASTDLAPEAQARVVKSALVSQGYPRSALLQSPEGGSQGSRELLLALSWLLARGPWLEQLLAQTRVQLGDELPQCECDILASREIPAPHVQTERPVDLRLVEWLMGKLRFRWRCLMSSQQEQCTLLSKIHLYTSGCHSQQRLGHLSVAETEMLRDPENGQQLLQALESENIRLEAALEWRRCELVFWQWMDTVLDACSLESPAVTSQPTVLPMISEHGLRELALVKQELQALQEELQEVAEPRRAAWEAQVGGIGQRPEWSTIRKTLQEAVERELVALQGSWEPSSNPAPPQRPHRLVRSKDKSPGPQGLQAAKVIRTLSAQEASLKSVLHQLQSQCQRELARLAGALPGLIWIMAPGH
ncbi:tubulin epsilon and delta complex protein 1 isoform X2 [Cricetulus griseus]|uniref:Tubulin epsilon and delta complex protein 1 isoform X2 n=1 Tax=Cricetulus griseus TaxID=10029 RepID=A0A9J7G1X4_CRIGR|nr:tubulin epsilon and delta complex protein 1 isoform X2 [Cricetulus griseus]